MLGCCRMALPIPSAEALFWGAVVYVCSLYSETGVSGSAGQLCPISAAELTFLGAAVQPLLHAAFSCASIMLR